MNKKFEKATLTLSSDLIKKLKQDAKTCSFKEILIHREELTFGRAKLLKHYEENFESLKPDLNVLQKEHSDLFFTNKVRVSVVMDPEKETWNFKVMIDTTVGSVPSKEDVIQFMRQVRKDVLQRSPLVRSLVHLLNNPVITDVFENQTKEESFIYSLLKNEEPYSMRQALHIARTAGEIELNQIRFNSLKHAGVGMKLPEGPAIAFFDFSNLPPASVRMLMDGGVLKQEEKPKSRTKKKV